MASFHWSGISHKNGYLACAIIIFLLVITFFSCDNASLHHLFLRTQKISDILSSPSKYDNKLVKVEGNVVESFIAFKKGFFILSDGFESITIVPSKTFPKIGEEVEIIGRVKSAFTI